MKKKILITGGHISPAVALIQELKRRGSYSIHVIGRKYVFFEAKDTVSFEYETIEQLGVSFIDLESPRFPRRISVQVLSYIFSLIKRIIVVMQIFRQIHPDIIISFGGYISVPVVLGAWLSRIPVVMHEQAIIPGRANRLLSRFAHLMCIAWEDSRKYFPESIQQRIHYTGNPIRSEIRLLAKKKHSSLEQKTIYITGGSSGAHRINTLVAKVLPQLLTKYHIVHQCGDSQFHDYEMLTQLRSNLPLTLQKQYELYKYITFSEIAAILNHTDIIVGRSGANTVIETALLGKPALLIPLPESVFDEQQKQAEVLKNCGSAIICKQNELTFKQFIIDIDRLCDNLKHYQHSAHLYAQSESILFHITAHKKLADSIDSLLYGHDSLVPEKL